VDNSVYHNEIKCQSSDKLISALLSILNQANSLYDNALFRGVGDLSYGLIPSAFRDTGEKRLTEVAKLESPEEEENCLINLDSFHRHVFFEIQALGHFYRFANQQGLRLPPLPQDLHQNMLRRKNNHIPFGNLLDIRKPWPPPELWSIMALAQHYGVPTRLLDWSTDPLIAAYFAAKSGVSKIEKHGTNGDIAVWVTFSHIFDQSLSLSKDPWLSHHTANDFPPVDHTFYVVDAPNFGNDNLTAQKGRFTLVVRSGMWADISTERLALDENMHILCKTINDSEFANLLFHGNKDPAESSKYFLKLTLPRAQATNLLMDLHKRGYHAARIYPGFKGCELAIAELEIIRKLTKIQ
jgi:FRG domain